MKYEVDAELWLWDSRQQDSWTFASIPAEVSDEIRDIAGGLQKRGFGSVRVRVTVGATTWQTSVFPDSKEGVYVLPFKKAVRTAEGLEAGDPVHLTLELLDV